MADTVARRTIYNGPKRCVVVATILSDGTGSTDAVLVDRSAFTGPDGTEPGRFVVEKVEYSVDGMSVQLEFDHDTDDLIAVVAGQGFLDFSDCGKYQGFVDPNSTGGTGDIVGTTVNHTAGDKAVMTFFLRKKD